MRLQLIHNPKAGQEDHGEDSIMARLRERGFEVELLSGDGGKRDWKGTTEAQRLVVVAGGDGTVGRALRTLSDDEVPLTVLPMGTANNIAFSLGIGDCPHVLEQPGAASATRQFALGSLRGPELEQLFVESVGFGLLTALMKADDHPDPPLPPHLLADEDGVRRPQRILHWLLDHWPLRPYAIEVDGRDLSGDYLLVEALNIPRIGPGLTLAPEQSPDSGRLVLALLGEAERKSFARYLEALMSGKQAASPAQRLSGRRIVIQARGGDMHVDDDCQHISEDGRWVIEADVRRVSVRI